MDDLLKGQNGHVDVVNFDDIINEADPFRATGFCHLKVQRGERTRFIRFPITSVPQDLLNDLQKRRPKPPMKKVQDPVSRQVTFEPDPNDPKYAVAAEEYQTELVRECVGRGVDTELTFKDGRVAKTHIEKHEALQERGLTASHFNELARAILGLTEKTEVEREQFL